MKIPTEFKFALYGVGAVVAYKIYVNYGITKELEEETTKMLRQVREKTNLEKPTDVLFQNPIENKNQIKLSLF